MRILGMTMLIVAIALAVTVVVLRQVLVADLADRIDRALAQEGNELVEYAGAAEARDGETGVALARRVLEEYLATNVTDPDEVMVAAQGGRPFLTSVDAPGDISPFVAGFGAVTEPTLVDIDTATGPARLLAQPIVADGRQAGLLAVAWFTAPEAAEVDRIVRNAALVASAALVAAAGLAWLVAGRVLRPIGLLADTAREITEHDLGRRLPEQGSDEIASLIVSFNAMVDRLDGALVSQRMFLDDAGHELRTPITIMRGHLEVLGFDPSDLDATRLLLLDELDRMGRIVDDLLVLAKAEQLDFLALGSVDTDDLLHTLMRRVTLLGDHDWQLAAAPLGVIEADEGRLVQAVLNLAANAARHTPPGGRIELGGRFATADAGGERSFSMWVADSGEGIDPADHGRIFERFRRASQPRSPGGSAGLGLAIVKAIAEAHGGTVQVDSRLGHGARFTITLPVAAAPTPDPADSVGVGGAAGDGTDPLRAAQIGG